MTTALFNIMRSRRRPEVGLLLAGDELLGSAPASTVLFDKSTVTVKTVFTKNS